ncbi:PREDICTED: uncharacterized protein LOC106107639 [Papilio polytes]|uniref:uncharacterized protein LOC106107639 n=1 Tax=Papilio polytes TaxID=76194 RepID=UPI00067619F0|nr:PREDICTED: uncharacterized protein LOC106107639 [Papilio polytes]
MRKITAIVSLMLIAWSQADTRRQKKEASSSEDFRTGNLLAAGLSCDSCGSECAAACGTRHFRACCFNYLRRKRGPDHVKLQQNHEDIKSERIQKTLPIVVLEIPEEWRENTLLSDFKPYLYDDTVGNRLDANYDV